MKYIFHKQVAYIGSSRLSAILLCFSLVLMSIAAGCDSQQPVRNDKLVVEGYIDSDGYPVVILSTSLMPTKDPQSFVDHLVRWGKVTIYDSTDSVILTGGVDRRVFPPFSYRSYYMKGRADETYRIKVEYDGMIAYASSRLMQAPSVFNPVIEQVAGSDSLRSLSVRFKQTDVDETCYYVAFTKVLHKDKRYMPSMFGTYHTDAPCDEHSLSLFRGKTRTDTTQYEPNFILGDTVSVLLSRVGKEEYEFWRQYQEQTNLGNTLFAGSSISLQGNVAGAYGCFTARAAKPFTVIIR